MDLDHNSFFESFIENHSSSICVLDLNYNLITFNSKYFITISTKYGIEVKKGLNLISLISDEVYISNELSLLNKVKNGESVRYNQYIKHDDSTIEKYYYPLLRDKVIIGIVQILTDITDKTEIEKSKALFESRQYAMSNMIPDFFMISDSNGIRKHVNKSFCDFFEVQPSEVIGTGYFQYISSDPDERKIYRTMINGLSPEFPTLTNVHFLKGPNGKRQWTLWNETGVFDKNGKFIEIISIGRNVNDLVKADLVRKEYIKVLEKAIFKTSHETRQPIVNILGIAELLDNDLISDKEFKNVVSYIRDSIQKLDGLTQELNNFIHNSIERQKQEKNDFTSIGNKQHHITKQAV